MPFDGAAPGRGPMPAILREFIDILFGGPAHLRWPAQFRWDYSCCESCAIGLLKQLYPQHVPPGFYVDSATLLEPVAALLSLPLSVACSIFLQLGLAENLPERLKLERYSTGTAFITPEDVGLALLGWWEGQRSFDNEAAAWALAPYSIRGGEFSAPLLPLDTEAAFALSSADMVRRTTEAVNECHRQLMDRLSAMNLTPTGRALLRDGRLMAPEPQHRNCRCALPMPESLLSLDYADIERRCLEYAAKHLPADPPAPVSNMVLVE